MGSRSSDRRGVALNNLAGLVDQLGHAQMVAQGNVAVLEVTKRPWFRTNRCSDTTVASSAQDAVTRNADLRWLRCPKTWLCVIQVVREGKGRTRRVAPCNRSEGGVRKLAVMLHYPHRVNRADRRIVPLRDLALIDLGKNARG